MIEISLSGSKGMKSPRKLPHELEKPRKLPHELDSPRNLSREAKPPTQFPNESQKEEFLQWIIHHQGLPRKSNIIKKTPMHVWKALRVSFPPMITITIVLVYISFGN